MEGRERGNREIEEVEKVAFRQISFIFCYRDLLS